MELKQILIFFLKNINTIGKNNGWVSILLVKIMYSLQYYYSQSSTRSMHTRSYAYYPYSTSYYEQYYAYYSYNRYQLALQLVYIQQVQLEEILYSLEQQYSVCGSEIPQVGQQGVSSLVEYAYYAHQPASMHTRSSRTQMLPSQHTYYVVL